MFANDLIKRIDLIDILIQRYAGVANAGGVDQQLRTLRASFEDILAQHGIKEFRIPPGTELDTELRQRIAVVENVSGPAKPRVVESFRPGFLYSTSGGRDVVLRKVEVKTSSE
jgi:molecular chaperone GrpE (heat shock protein)